MASFNMQEFHEILEKCKDRSQQEKQDQVCTILIVVINQLVFNAQEFLNVIRVIYVIHVFIFRLYFSRSIILSRFPANRFAQNSD